MVLQCNQPRLSKKTLPCVLGRQPMEYLWMPVNIYSNTIQTIQNSKSEESQCNKSPSALLLL